MKTSLLLLLCCLSWHTWAQHQHPDWGLPCGTAPGRSEFLKEYQRNPSLYPSQRNATVYLPLSMHLVGRSDGSGAVALQSVLSSFCQLNADYSGSGIQFFIEFPIHYHYSDSMHTHSSVTYGGGFMLQHNIPNTINVYFVSSPAGNCGYNLPYAGIAMNNGCLGGHTFAHEMGHALTLPHTFLGWEGGVSWDGSIQPDFNRPAPRRVTYNYTEFKDTMWTDTLIIDTTETEIVARTGATANCDVAADGFCDTEADYLAYRWACNASGLSTVRQLDADSVAFFSRGEYIMSYADDNCQSRFTPEQIGAMNAFIGARRQSYLYNQNPLRDSILTTANLIQPNGAALVAQTNLNFVWNAVPNASHYLLELYREPYASNTIIQTVVVTDTSFTYQGSLPPRPAVFPYGWRVQAFNQGYTCTWMSPVTNFNTFIPAGTERAQTEQDLRLFPNPSNGNGQLSVQIHSEIAQAGSLKIYNSIGQLVSSLPVEAQQGENLFTVDLSSLAAGIYVVEWASAQGKICKKWLKS